MTWPEGQSSRVAIISRRKSLDVSPDAVQCADLRESGDLVAHVEPGEAGFRPAWERAGSVGARLHDCSERARFHDEPFEIQTEDPCGEGPSPWVAPPSGWQAAGGR